MEEEVMNDSEDIIIAPSAIPPRSTIDIYEIQEMASRIMCDLGAGYSEAIYQRALFNKIARIDISAVMEKTVPVLYENELIGTCRADIVTSNYVVEIKAVRNMSSNVGNQICKYMKILHENDGILREGLVVNFNQEFERVDFLAFSSPNVNRLGWARQGDYRRRRVTQCE